MEYICPVCGEAGEDGQHFCIHCGAVLQPNAEQPAQVDQTSGDNASTGKRQWLHNLMIWAKGTDNLKREQENDDRPSAKSPYAILNPLQFFGSLFLMLLPVVGLVIAIFWSMGYCRKANKRNLARAVLVWYALLLLLVLFLRIAFPARFLRVTEALTGKQPETVYMVPEEDKASGKSDETAEREIAGWDSSQKLSFSGFPSAKALNLLMSGEYYIQYTMYAFGMSTVREQAKSEGRFVEVETMSGQKIRTLTMDGVCYEIDDQKEQYCILGQRTEGQTLPFGGTLSSLERVSSGSGQVNGVDCKYDEFVLQGSGTGEAQRTVRLYVKGDSLQAIYMEEPLLGGQIMMQVQTLTKEIPDDLLDFPSSYKQVTYDEMVHPGLVV